LDSTHLTSHAVARLIGVSASAVLSWIDKGLLAAHRTPGGHRRVEKTSLVRFLRHHAMPIPPALAGANRILVIEGDRAARRHIQRVLRQHAPHLAVEMADGPVDGLLRIGLFRPDAIVLDTHVPGTNVVDLCSRIRSLPETEHIRIVVVATKPSQQIAAAYARAGAAACLARPLDPNRLLEILQRGTGRDAR